MNATVYFEEDLIAQILDRLPVKTLLRCRCVSKPCCSLIDSPHFVKAHLKRSAECNTNTGLIIRGVHSDWLYADSLHDSTTSVEIDETLRTLLLGTSLVGSCNGLICTYKPKTGIFLWNLATRRFRKLPTAPSDFLRPFEIDPFLYDPFLYGFGYDAVNDDYKVLSIFHPDGCDLDGSELEVVVYSLKNNSWRRLSNISNDFLLTFYYGMFLGLHWITNKTLGSESCQSILAFDLAAENYREVPIPKVRINNPHEWSLCIFAESLCVLIFHHPYICIDIWLMNDYGVGNSWCKLFSLEHQEIIRSFVSAGLVAYSKSRKDVLVQVVMRKLIWYNLETKEIKTVKIGNMPSVFHQVEVYTESLVAPDYIHASNEKQQ